MTTEMALKRPQADLALLVRQYGVELNIQTDYQFAASGPKKMITGCLPSITKDSDLARAIETVEQQMNPATSDRIDGWLAELSVITKRRKESDAVEALTLAAYRRRLMAYPGRVVYEALVMRTYHFWPSWDELKVVCDELVRPWNLILKSLKEKANGRYS